MRDKNGMTAREFSKSSFMNKMPPERRKREVSVKGIVLVGKRTHR